MDPILLCGPCSCPTCCVNQCVSTPVSLLGCFAGSSRRKVVPAATGDACEPANSCMLFACRLGGIFALILARSLLVCAASVSCLCTSASAWPCMGVNDAQMCPRQSVGNFAGGSLGLRPSQPGVSSLPGSCLGASFSVRDKCDLHSRVLAKPCFGSGLCVGCVFGVGASFSLLSVLCFVGSSKYVSPCVSPCLLSIA